MVSGVVEVVGGGPRAEPIPDEEINALKLLMQGSLPYDAHPYLHEGTVVRVIRGPLEGVQGILVRKAQRCRLVLSVHLIQQAAAVELDAADVVPVSPPPARYPTRRGSEAGSFSASAGHRRPQT